MNNLQVSERKKNSCVKEEKFCREYFPRYLSYLCEITLYALHIAPLLLKFIKSPWKEHGKIIAMKYMT